MELQDALVNPRFLMQQVEYAVAEMLPEAARVTAHYFEDTGAMHELREEAVEEVLRRVKEQQDPCVCILLLDPDDGTGDAAGGVAEVAISVASAPEDADEGATDSSRAAQGRPIDVSDVLLGAPDVPSVGTESLPGQCIDEAPQEVSPLPLLADAEADGKAQAAAALRGPSFLSMLAEDEAALQELVAEAPQEQQRPDLVLIEAEADSSKHAVEHGSDGDAEGPLAIASTGAASAESPVTFITRTFRRQKASEPVPAAAGVVPVFALAASEGRTRLVLQVHSADGTSAVLEDAMDLDFASDNPRAMSQLAYELGRRAYPGAEAVVVRYEDEEGDECTLTDTTATDALSYAKSRDDSGEVSVLKLSARPRPDMHRAPIVAGTVVAQPSFPKLQAWRSSAAHSSSAALPLASFAPQPSAASAAQQAAELPHVTHVFQRPRMTVEALPQPSLEVQELRKIRQWQDKRLAEYMSQVQELESQVQELKTRDWEYINVTMQMDQFKRAAHENIRRAEELRKASEERDEDVAVLRHQVEDAQRKYQHREEETEALRLQYQDLLAEQSEAAERRCAKEVSVVSDMQKEVDQSVALAQEAEQKAVQAREAEARMRVELEETIFSLRCKFDEDAALGAKLDAEVQINTNLQQELSIKSAEITSLHDTIRCLCSKLEERECSRQIVDNLHHELSGRAAELQLARSQLAAASQAQLVAAAAAMAAKAWDAKAWDPKTSAQVLSSEPDMAGVEMDVADDPTARADVSREFAPTLDRLGAVQAFRVGRVRVEVDQEPFPIVYAVTVQNTGQTNWPLTTMLVHESGDALGLPVVELGPVAPGDASTIAFDVSVPKATNPGSATSTWVMRDVATGRPLGPVLIFESEWVDGQLFG